jgi:hypothetical protein
MRRLALVLAWESCLAGSMSPQAQSAGYAGCGCLPVACLDRSAAGVGNCCLLRTLAATVIVSIAAGAVRYPAESDLRVMHAAQHSSTLALPVSDFPGHRAELGAWRVPCGPGHDVGADDPPAGPAHAREFATPVTESQLRNNLILDP